MASIERRNGQHSVRWRTLGGQERRRQCPTSRSAQTLKREIEEAHATGREWQPQSARGIVDFEEVAEAFIRHRETRLRKRTLLRYAEDLDLFVRFLRTAQPRGPLAASTLSRPLLEDFYAWLCKPDTGLHGRMRSADTARKIAEVVQLCWQWADESERWLGRIPRPRRIEMTRSLPDAVVAPSWEEMDACVRACRGWHRQLAMVLRYTGLRVGECMLLEWRDVSLRERTLTIRSEINKTGNGRVVPLSEHLVEHLVAWGERSGWLIPSGRRQGDRYRQARARDIARAWTRADVRDAAWEGRPAHAFRRGWKSGLLALGGHPDAIDFLQGHALGRGGARARYIDAWQALPLRDTIGLVPKIADDVQRPADDGVSAPRPAQ